MTRRLYRRYLQGYTVYTNYHVNFPHVRVDAKWLMRVALGEEDLQDCAMGIDELGVVMGARNFGTKRNKILAYFVVQTRKRNVVLFGTVQNERQVDVLMRINVDYWVICERVVIRKRVNDRIVKVKTHRYRYSVIDSETWQRVKFCEYDGTLYYHLYNTKEVITDFDL